MMVVAPLHAQMEIRPEPVRQGAEEVLDELRGKVPHALTVEAGLQTAVRTAAEVEHRFGSRFVHRDGVPVPADSFPVSKGLSDRVADRQSRVLDRVVFIHVQVSGNGH